MNFRFLIFRSVPASAAHMRTAVFADLPCSAYRVPPGSREPVPQARRAHRRLQRPRNDPPRWWTEVAHLPKARRRHRQGRRCCRRRALSSEHRSLLRLNHHRLPLQRARDKPSAHPWIVGSSPLPRRPLHVPPSEQRACMHAYSAGCHASALTRRARTKRNTRLYIDSASLRAPVLGQIRGVHFGYYSRLARTRIVNMY